MKKILLFAAIMLLITISGCSASDNVAKNTTETTKTTTETEAETMQYDSEELINMYCNGSWDGTFISEEFHCASIEEGFLWIDCKNTYQIPDMGNTSTLWSRMISCSEEGTWIYDEEFGYIELWKDGIKLETINCFTDHGIIYKLPDGFVAHFGSSIKVYQLDGNITSSFDNIVDCYQKNCDDTIFVSNFQHESFIISSTEEIIKLEADYIRFPRIQIGIMENYNYYSETTKTAVELFYAGWDGKLEKIDDNFVIIDYDGNIIVNNQFAGNVAIGSELIPSDNKGVNIYLDSETSYWLNDSELVKFKKGVKETIDIPDGSAEFLWVDNDKGIIIRTYNNQLIFVGTDDTVKVISTKAVDANVAYDTLYYMEGDTVYSLLWKNKGATPQVFFEGAYAVSPEIDECEGALVPYEQANYKARGYSNIYSPYGIQID